MLLTVGLAAKNAILIVEFAKDIFDKEGKSAFDAAVEAAHQRLASHPDDFLCLHPRRVYRSRLASGAGSGAENAIGTGVVGGMLSATLLTLFFAPLFFVLVYALTGKRHDGKGKPDKASTGSAATGPCPGPWPYATPPRQR